MARVGEFRPADAVERGGGVLEHQLGLSAIIVHGDFADNGDPNIDAGHHAAARAELSVKHDARRIGDGAERRQLFAKSPVGCGAPRRSCV